MKKHLYAFKYTDSRQFVFESNGETYHDGNDMRFKSGIVVSAINPDAVGELVTPMIKYCKKIVNYNYFWTKFNES